MGNGKEVSVTGTDEQGRERRRWGHEMGDVEKPLRLIDNLDFCSSELRCLWGAFVWGETPSVLCFKTTILAALGRIIANRQTQKTNQRGVCKNPKKTRCLSRLVKCGQILDIFWRSS